MEHVRNYINGKWMDANRGRRFSRLIRTIKKRSLGSFRIVNGTRFGLSSAIYTQDVNASAIAERNLETGIAYINASTIGAEIQLPFGGVKQSGFGRKEAGGLGGGLGTYSRWKVIYRDFSGKIQEAQIDK